MGLPTGLVDALPFTLKLPVLLILSDAPVRTSTDLAVAVVLMMGEGETLGITASSLVNGTRFRLQLVGVFQLVLVAPVQLFWA